MEIVRQPLGTCDAKNCQEDIYGQSFYCLKCIKRHMRCVFCKCCISGKICLDCCNGFKEWLSSNLSINLELAKYYIFKQFNEKRYIYGPKGWLGFYAGEKWVKFNLDKESFNSKEINEENCVERITEILESNGIYLKRDIQCNISSLTKSARK